MKAAPPNRPPGPSWRRIVAWSLVVVALASACGVREGALQPKGPVAENQADVFYIAFWTAVVVYAVTAGLLLFGMFRRRREEDGRFPGTRFVVVGGIVVPTVILLAMMVVNFSYLSQGPEEGDLEITITGYQYWWEAYYHDRDFVTANEIHIPVGVDVEFHLESDDVIHSFWVPELGGKQDLVPGRVNDLILRADEEGTYRGQCAEYCGLQHANMGFLVIAQDPEEFEAWAELESRPAVVEDARGEELFVQHSCAGCHTIRGTEADGEIGPDLTHVGSRTTLAAGTIQNGRGQMAGWILNSQTVKPGNEMPPIPTIEPEDLHALVDYLRRLE